MPVRAVVFLSIGSPIGGFRIAGRAGLFGLDNPRAFEALERAIETAYSLFAAHPPAEWPVVSQSGFDVAVPRLGEREGYIDCATAAAEAGSGEVVLRACLPFPGWPLGGWVVYEGRHLEADGTWTPFTTEQEAALW